MSLQSFPSVTKERIRKFRLSTSRASKIELLPIKIGGRPSFEIVVDDEEFEELKELEELGELQEYLPANAPRYVLMAYPMTTRDNIQKVPLVMLYWKPPTVVSQELKMLYANSLELVRQECGVSKLVEVSELDEESEIDELVQQIES